MGYIATADETVVINEVTTSKEIDLTGIIDKYIELRNEILGLPKTKTEPDEETLSVYNTVIEIQNIEDLAALKVRASDLYDIVKPIYDAGLFPSQYETQYLQLENFVTTI